MGTTLREALEASVAEQEETAGQTGNAETPAPEAPAAQAGEQAASSAQAGEQDKPGRTAGRARDDKGRLLPGPAKREESTESPTPASQPQALAQAPKKIQRPSSWKKDHWEAFDQLAATNPQLAEYINSRESDFAKGVSTYRQQWEQEGKPLVEAIAPHRDLIQQYGINVPQQIDRYFRIHQSLALGSPEAKLSVLAQIARDYQIPVHNLFVRGQDGQLYYNQAFQAQAQQQSPQQSFDPSMVKSLVQEHLTNERTAQAIAEFEAQAPEKYPHYETVKATMAGLLQAGLAQDLPSAYEASLRMPQHSDIWEAQQQQQRQADETRKREEAARTAQRARQNAVSTKTATPTGSGNGAGAKGLRASLEAAVEAQEGGRV